MESKTKMKHTSKSRNKFLNIHQEGVTCTHEILRDQKPDIFDKASTSEGCSLQGG
ncbi:unnamed protein product [Eretmochelys imbricata]